MTVISPWPLITAPLGSFENPARTERDRWGPANGDLFVADKLIVVVRSVPVLGYHTIFTVFGSQSGLGYCGFISSRVSRTMRAIAALRTQWRSAGITYQGA